MVAKRMLALIAIAESALRVPCVLTIFLLSAFTTLLVYPSENRETVVNWWFLKGISHMKFVVGETVVYPHHGAAKIIEVGERTLRGETKTYLQLKVAQSELTIWVPAENAGMVGVRDVIDKKGVEQVFGVLRAEFTEEPTNWSRRYKANVEKLASGDVLKVSEVVRDLWRRDQDRGLSAGEKRMLIKARQILVSELALARKTDEPKADATLEEVLNS